MKMTRHVHILTMLIGALVAAAGCGNDGGSKSATPTSHGPGPAGDSADCTDEAENPYAGVRCLNDFFNCFMPAGQCTGEIGLTGSLTLTWENGAKLESSPDFSGIMVDPAHPPSADELMNLGANTLLATNGILCMTSTTKLETDDGCESKSVYIRTSDGATAVFCSDADGNTKVTCPDGSTTDVMGTEGAANCQYGGGNGQCDIKQPKPPSTPGNPYT
jgi:hypothetical protein